MALRKHRSSLEELLHGTQSRSALVLQLSKQQDWRCMINQKQDLLDAYSVHTLLKIFGKSLSSRLHRLTQRQIVDVIINSNFLTTHLVKFIDDLFTSRSRNPHLFTNKLSCIITFLEVLQIFDADVHQISNHCNHYMKSHVGNVIDKNLRQKFDRIRKPYQHDTNVNEVPSHGYQNDYKLTPILPTAEELTNQDCDRKVVSFIYYKSFRHYLSTQFFILRNDLIAPLKSSIRKFLGESAARNQENCWNVYQYVQIKAPVQTKDGSIVYELHFDVRPFKDIDWKNSRKLIYGSLLCLSADAFKTVTYAVVHSRAEVHKGIVSVRFINEQGEETDQNTIERLYSTYMMAESPAFSEMYCSLLRGLQDQIITNHHYLIHTEPEIRVPSYLKQKPTFNLSCLLNEAAFRNYYSKVDVQDFSNWPETALNLQQEEALHKALTSSISLIHTPPGTGKLYIGVKIVETFLLNVVEISKEPILVLFPNDTLMDKFLKCPLPKEDIVRVGGFTLDKSMQRYSISKAVDLEMRKSSYFQSLFDIEKEISRMRETIFEFELFRYYKTFHILHESALKDLPNPDDQLIQTISRQFHCEDKSRNSAIFSWLGLFSEDKDHMYLPSITDLSEDKPNSGTMQKSSSSDCLQASENSTEKSEMNVSHEDDTFITEVGIETMYRKFDIPYHQINSEIKNHFDEKSHDHLEIDSLNDPFYVYNVEAYRDTKDEDIIDEETRERVEYIRKNFNQTQSKCQKWHDLCSQELRKTDTFSIGERQLPDVVHMNLKDRWKLYRRWIQIKDASYEEHIKILKEEYERKIKSHQELISQIEHDVLRKSKMIAITVNAAAKFQPILQEIGCKFIIVEDAAQVLESQISVLLTPKTENLILIGDHQRLRRRVTTNFQLKETKLDISLFERLARNKIPSTALSLQYRMRPEISKLCMHVHSDMLDDQSVLQLPDVLGMRYNVFFVKHEHKEQLIHRPNGFVNIFESKFIVALCQYLLDQGYKSHQITILTPYFSQVSEIQQRIPKNQSYKDVQVMPFEYYQGEHNDIILMSLVTKNVVRYLRDDPGITMAISRAELGVYALGNFDLLDRESPLWHKILSAMKANQLNALPVVCQRHPKSQAMIIEAEDFSTLTPNGGCLEDCKTVLACGHRCNKKCHGGKHAFCVEPCRKKCKEGHPCIKLCTEPCPPCTTAVIKALTCSHKVKVPCSTDPDPKMCMMACAKTCKNGHPCTTLCRERCPPCAVAVTKKLPCGHMKDMSCFTDPTSEKCLMPCARTCKNGHPCAKLCKERCPPCAVAVTRKLPCGHMKDMSCSANPDSQECLMPCARTCSEGHLCTLLCSSRCLPCTITVTKKFTCGHMNQLPCSSKPEQKLCTKVCSRKCERGHPCSMLCKEPCQPCLERVEKELLCGHKETISCYINPVHVHCKKRIRYKFLKCGHLKEIFCYQKNGRPICSVDCDYRLDCGHKCHLKCHTAIDAYHENPVCEKPCEKTLTCLRGHSTVCTNLCKDRCSPCTAMMSKPLQCGHAIRIECCNSSKTLICQEICSKYLSCGHKCNQRCRDECLCTTLVERNLPCGHTASVSCKFKDAKLQEVTGKPATYVFKIIVKGFWIFVSESTTKEIVCTKPCLKKMACGHICRNACNKPCSIACPLTSNRVQNCGHVLEIACTSVSQHPDLINKSCQTACNKMLPCSHQCKGTCGKCFQGRVHVPCQEKCGRVQICGHVCDVPCSEACPPCTKKCPNRCPHSRCPYQCGKPCQQCAERCEWICPHYRCTRLCGEECNRKPCDEPCLKKLKCEHPCVGLCGEVCPPQCRICNREELIEFQLLCLEDEPDSRFVYLEDCGHCIEVTALDQWINQSTIEIGMKSCPRCKTTIWRCQRYGNVIRRCIREVQQVKQKIFGKIGNLQETMMKLRRQLIAEDLVKTHLWKYYDMINARLSQGITLHYHACNVIENQILILHSLAKLLNSKDAHMHKQYHEQHTLALVARLMMHEYRVSPQELQAIGRECRRIKLTTAMMAIDLKYSCTTKVVNENIVQINKIRTILHSGTIVTDRNEEIAKTLFQKIQDKIPGLDITEEERLMIINALDVGKQGHWFKCPNGHPYAIGECGGAMERSKCPDCGVVVGGINHALDAGNYHAGDIDGSRYARYSEAANLENYDPRDLE